MIAVSFYAPRKVPQHRYDFIDCLRVQRATCRRYGVKQIVLTDQDLPDDLIQQRLRLPGELMPAILTAQLWMVRTNPNEDLLLIGADCILGHDPTTLFDGSFDLAVTTHPFPDCILNTGLIAVAAGKGALVAPVWEKALDLCGPAWGDDQHSMAEVLQPTLRHGVELRDGLRVKFLPVPGYNDAPDHPRDMNNALVVHFRGPRKEWMREWSERFGKC